MDILIPIGGLGTRFKKNGYLKPKALINVFGKSIINYLIDSLNTNLIDNIIIPYNKEYSKFRFEDKLKKDYPEINFIFIKLEKNTDGAAETINIALKKILYEDKPILCLDSDNFYTIDIVKIWNGENKIITFEDVNDKPIYSYIKINEKNVIDILEKQKISNYACCGAYGFSSRLQLLKYTQMVIDNDIKEKNEFYTSVVIKEMINNKIDFIYSVVNKNDWICLGTPIQVMHFYNKYSFDQSIIKRNNQRICFDLDNTLVTFPKIDKDYTSVEPIEENINLLRNLKNMGHTIIIYTARRMKTHKGNVGKIIQDVGKITVDTLEKFKIPYDELYFGKPNANFYIDDLAVNCFDDIEKEIGYHNNKIVPREFNSIESKTISIIEKKSSDLSGEIYYYNNIPHDIKDLFPILFDYSKNNTSYKVEKINGVTATNLYTSEILTNKNLKNIMDSIERIHNTKVKNTSGKQNINIYDNYVKKLKSRYEKYDYTKFENSEIIYQTLIQDLEKYENSKKGKKTIIHGDPVMTNIIIDYNSNIKFIDMRGKIGNKLTIYGDYMYDWAKLYQSLIGYDKILMNKNIKSTYEKEMIQYFENYFTKKFGENKLKDLKLITKSLLFTLIPLHNNDKCYSYYKLINNI